ncbi:hypothetical protein Q5O24_05885 [Eubacteriaceae bacterium ES3]|nr:hypothetical protein Q5O24_05885 [Eubacteriaceae bacterium ES3]
MKNSIRRLILFIACLSMSLIIIFIQKPGATLSEKPVALYYLTHFKSDSGALNAVTSIYLNYRVFDTLLETLILLICVIAVIHFSWRKDSDE